MLHGVLQRVLQCVLGERAHVHMIDPVQMIAPVFCSVKCKRLSAELFYRVTNDSSQVGKNDSF